MDGCFHGLQATAATPGIGGVDRTFAIPTEPHWLGKPAILQNLQGRHAGPDGGVAVLFRGQVILAERLPLITELLAIGFDVAGNRSQQAAGLFRG